MLNLNNIKNVSHALLRFTLLKNDKCEKSQSNKQEEKSIAESLAELMSQYKLHKPSFAKIIA